jgi:hypothetical protein
VSETRLSGKLGPVATDVAYLGSGSDRMEGSASNACLARAPCLSSLPCLWVLARVVPAVRVHKCKRCVDVMSHVSRPIRREWEFQLYSALSWAEEPSHSSVAMGLAAFRDRN